MNDKLGWAVRGHTFEDGSRLSDWTEIHRSPDWHWQYDTHELSFSIYEHDGQYWKLYRARFVERGTAEYRYDYGGVACRVVLVEYSRDARSPHSSMLERRGDREWIRVGEHDPEIHRVITSGERDPRYGEPYRGADAA